MNGPASDCDALPEACSVAFKEWAGVCEALAEGPQSLILRKGGIEEGPGGFVPEHRAFWLYPTHLHQAEQGLRVTGVAREHAECDDQVALRALAVVAAIHFDDRLDRLESLEALHVWANETIEKRFHYRKPGLWVLGVRVYRTDRPHAVTPTAEHAGCKTWVPLGSALSTNGLAPALSDEAFRHFLEELHARLELPTTPPY